MKPLYSWISIALLALGLTLTGCSEGSDRTDAGSDADAAQPDGDAGVDGDAEPSDGDAGDTPDETTVVLKVERVIPSRGPVGGGIWVNIKGSGFVEGIQYSPFGLEEVTEVVFGDNPAIDIEVIRDDLISVGTPAGITGPVDVTVENPNGRVTFADGFSYYENVTALRVDPPDFSCGGGTPFSVEGTGFTPDTTAVVGGRPASAVVVESATKISAVAPPGSPGLQDVEIINRNGRALLFKVVTYHPVPSLRVIEPAAGPEAGGTAVVASGEGFEESVELLFGAAPATGLLCPAPDSLQAVTPAGSGTVDVTVAGLLDSSTLAGGFVFLPDPTGSLTVTGVSPAAGPVAGGGLVTAAGEGFAAGVDQVLFGSNPSSDVQVQDDRRLTAAVPAGAVGTTSVTVSAASDQSVLPDAYRYFQPIGVDGIDPATGEVEGGTAFSLQGSGFHQAVEVFFDGVPAQSLSVTSGTVLSGVTPPGSPGPADVLVKDADSQFTLPGAFEYTTDLSLTRIHPDYGAQAGGTYVVCYGSGFAQAQSLRIWFGDQEASDVQVSSSSVVTAYTPPGSPGYVPVRIEFDGGDAFELPEGFYYYDPTNYQGGASGGPIRGSFNVTVLNGDRTLYGQPIPGAIVVVEDPPIAGTTDESGQVTFSGPGFVRAVTVTVAKEEFESVTVADLNATNLTIFLFPSASSTDLSDQPQCEHESILSGRVFGFKDIPGLPTGPTILMQAVLYFAADNMFRLPPFSSAPEGLAIEEDGGQFDIQLCWGSYTIYALYGAFDIFTEEFTTALFGMRRGIQLFTDEPLTDQDIVLGTYLNQSVSIHLQDPPVAPGGAQTIYRTYAHLDLGRDGVIYFGEDDSTGLDMQIDGLPSATSDSFVFIGLASVYDSYPFSYTFRRPQGNLSDGITLGPFLGFAEINKPGYGADLSDGLIIWSVQDPQPELIEMIVMTNEFPPRYVWRMILPGDATQVTLPPEALALLPKQQPLFLILYTADSPYFRFDSFNYFQLGTDHWTSYTVNYTVFTML